MSKPDVNNWLRALTFAGIPGNWSLECTQTKILYHIRSNEGRYAEVKRTFLRLVRIVSSTSEDFSTEQIYSLYQIDNLE
ncbi:hypothetical protein HZH68_014505 [Vespula germanica]|uniref:Uncharacterized protein n=1 Tax=Vespula germanica TaxID=30212 RepID=A0A834MUS1_VESGE|nr:hypothetical protein HZH68_014505 [Vespula germanica]